MENLNKTQQVKVRIDLPNNPKPFFNRVTSINNLVNKILDASKLIKNDEVLNVKVNENHITFKKDDIDIKNIEKLENNILNNILNNTTNLEQKNIEANKPMRDIIFPTNEKQELKDFSANNLDINNDSKQNEYTTIVIDTLQKSNKELRDNITNHFSIKEPERPDRADDKYINNDLTKEQNDKAFEQDQSKFQKEYNNYASELSSQLKVFKENNLDIPPRNYLDLNKIFNVIKELNMNDNIKFLQDKVKMLGFGDSEDLKNTIEKEVKGNNIDFSINQTTDKNFFKNNSINFDLNFHRSKDTGTVFLNSYQVNLHNSSKDQNKDLSYLVELKKIPLTAKESINLIEGRNVKTDLKFKDQDKESYFVKLDFSNIKDNKIQSLNKFRADLVKDTKEILKSFKIYEDQKHPTIIDKLSKSLEKGNVVPILIKNDSGKNEKLNATLFPQMNTLNLYDDKMKRVNITQSLSNGVSTEQKKTEHISQYNNSRKP